MVTQLETAVLESFGSCWLSIIACVIRVGTLKERARNPSERYAVGV